MPSMPLAGYLGEWLPDSYLGRTYNTLIESYTLQIVQEIRLKFEETKIPTNYRATR
jgi:hypothetical protein